MVFNKLMKFLLRKDSSVYCSAVDSFTYETVDSILTQNGIPSDFVHAENPKLRHRYIDIFGEIRKELFEQHLKSLPKDEQTLIRDGQHASQSHRFAEHASDYAVSLKNRLSDLGYVNDVKIGYYHMDRIVLTIELKEEVEEAVWRRDLPWLYMGFETRVMRT